MTKELTPLQDRFVDEYLKDLNATQAAERAGSKAKNLRTAGAEFLANPNVQAEIDRRKLDRSQKTQIDANWVLTRLAEEAEADVADLYGADGELLPVKQWPKIWRQGLVAGLDVEEITVEGVKVGIVRKIKLSDRIKRLELIGKHVKVNAFQDTINHKGLDGLADKLARAKKRKGE